MLDLNNSCSGQHMGNFIGEFTEYDENNSTGIWRSYMRIMVRVDVHILLKKEKKVRKLGGEWRIVHFKCKKLGTFFFLMWPGHGDQFCPQIFSLEKDDGCRGWGPELRVDLRRNGGQGSSRWLQEEKGGFGKNSSYVLKEEVTHIKDGKGPMQVDDN